MSDKYEYMVEVWGSFYNEEHKAKHKQEPGNYWFATKEERGQFIRDLEEIRDKCYPKEIIVKDFCEGTLVRYRTKAKMNMVYAGKSYPYEFDHGYGTTDDMVLYTWEDGNYSCDCNRSLFLGELYDVPQLKCGDEIEIQNFEIVKVKVKD